MPKLFSVICFLLAMTQSGFSQNERQYQDYDRDAVQLAARFAAGLNEDAEISNYTIAELTVALHAISAYDHEAAKIVTEELNIHAFEYANTVSTKLYVDATTKWAIKLSENKILVEKTPLGRLFMHYDLKIESIETLDELFVFTVKSNTPKNMKFVANNLSFADAVIMAEIPAPSGDGSDIEAKKTHDGWIISYHYKYQDCISGCKKQYTWQFGVRANEEVEFLGSFGELPQNLKDKLVMNYNAK